MKKYSILIESVCNGTSVEVIGDSQEFTELSTLTHSAQHQNVTSAHPYHQVAYKFATSTHASSTTLIGTVHSCVD
jgi:hypothetical protein